MDAHHPALRRLALAALFGLAPWGLSSAGEPGPDANTAFRYGLAAFAQRNLDLSINWHGYALQVDPKMAVAWLGRSMAGMEKHWQELSTQAHPNPDMKKAIEDDAIEAQRLDPRVFDAFRQAAGPQLAQAVDDFAHHIDVLASGHSVRAQALMAENKIPDALAACDRAVALLPAKPVFRYMRGFFCRDFGQLDKAIADFDELERLYRASPDDKTLLAFYRLSLIERGKAYRDKGDLNRALADLSEAVRLAPTNANAWLARGITYIRKGELDNALPDLDKAIALDAHPAEAYYQRGIARVGKNDRNGAFADFNEAIRIDPKHANAHYAKGFILIEANQLDAGIASLNEALRANPQFPACWMQRGRAFLAKGNLDQAIIDLTEAIRQAPNSAEAYRLRADAYERKGDQANAAADRQRAAHLQPPRP